MRDRKKSEQNVQDLKTKFVNSLWKARSEVVEYTEKGDFNVRLIKATKAIKEVYMRHFEGLKDLNGQCEELEQEKEDRANAEQDWLDEVDIERQKRELREQALKQQLEEERPDESIERPEKYAESSQLELEFSQTKAISLKAAESLFENPRGRVQRS